MQTAAATVSTIHAQGPFNWAASLDVVERFGPVRRYASGGQDPLCITFLLDGTFEPTAAAIRPTSDGLAVTIAGTTDAAAATRQVARIFSLDHDGSGFAQLADRDPAFGRVQAALPGLRPVNFPSPYECAAWAVISQRISMQQAAVIQDRMIAAYGSTLEIAGETVRVFPTPMQLLGVDEVASLPAEKLTRLHSVAQAALDGILDADRLRALGDVEGPGSVRAIRGIGPFWASGIYLRACGIVDVFPDEPIAIAALGALHGLGDRPSDADLERLTDAYRPYRMWACFLLRVAANRGLIPGIAGREMRIREASATRGQLRATRG